MEKLMAHAEESGRMRTSGDWMQNWHDMVNADPFKLIVADGVKKSRGGQRLK
jgi:hypothetical protein